MLLRHMTHRHHMKSIVTRGGLSPAFQVDAPKGLIAFEVDPPSEAYQMHFHQLKSGWQDAERLGVSIKEIGSFAFIHNFVSLDYLIESSREKISEYY